jgi:uncharacterized damage-inducible protein DinB
MSETGSRERKDLGQTAAVDFAAYFRHLATRVDRAARSVTEQQLWASPLPFGNSIGHLVLHLTGNLNHYIGALVAGSGYVRDRQHEFTDSARYPLDQVLTRFHQSVDMVVSTLEAHDETAFCSPVLDQPPIRSRLGLFLVCAAHMNNHVGQMSYLVQAFQTTTKESPIW